MSEFSTKKKFLHIKPSSYCEDIEREQRENTPFNHHYTHTHISLLLDFSKFLFILLSPEYFFFIPFYYSGRHKSNTSTPMCQACLDNWLHEREREWEGCGLFTYTQYILFLYMYKAKCKCQLATTNTMRRKSLFFFSSMDSCLFFFFPL